MGEDTTPGISGNRTLSSNRWVIRKTLLQNILDNWAVFQELWDRILQGKVDSQIQNEVIGVHMQIQSFNLFFLNMTWSFSILQYKHVML